MDKRKLIIASIVVVVLIGVGALTFFLAKKNGGEGGNGGIFGFLPFGQDIDSDESSGPGLGGLTGDNIYGTTENAEFFRPILVSVSGAAAKSDNTIRYVEQATGHIYEKDLSKTEEPKRVSNTTILKSFDAIWSKDASKAIVRYLDDEYMYPQASSFSLAISESPESATTTLGVFLSSALTALAASPFEDKIFYLDKTISGATGFIANFDDTKKTSIFTPQISEFNADWPNKDIVAIQTRPSSGTEGFLYFLNPKTGSLDKVIGGIKGLATLVSPDAKKVLFSENSARGPMLKLFDVARREAYDFQVNTLPEKCAWSKNATTTVYCAVPSSFPSGEYPDSWYQGLISFSNDMIWEINIQNGTARILIENSNADATKLFLTQNGNYLLFINKKDNTLWALKIPQNQ